MNPALFLLLWLRFRGWLRRLGRSLRTVRGALLAGFGFLLVGVWLLSVTLPMLLSRPEAEPYGRLIDPADTRRFGTLGLLAYCLLLLFTSVADKALSFSPAEVSLLFPGPFSRRQLLLYRITGNTLVSLLTTVFFTLMLRVYTPSVLSGFVGSFLVLLFFQLFAMAVALVSSTLGEYASTRRRQFVLGFLGLLLLGVVVSTGRETLALPPRELLARAEAAPLFRILLLPLRCFVETFTAAHVWPDLIGWGLLAAAVDGALVLLVLVLDAHYLETSAAASERLYARLQRIRSGDTAAAMSLGLPGRFRLNLADLPWWGGVGPIAWRQMQTVLRSLKGLLVIVLTLTMMMTGPALAGGYHGAGADFTLTIVIMMFAMIVLLLPLLPFDFRGDIDRMDVLKALPISAVRLVIGQLCVPVFLAGMLQMLVLFAVEAIFGGLGVFVPATLFMALPFNVVLFEIVNLFFLLFPTRLASGPSDIHLMGRQMLFLFVIYFSIFLVVGLASVVGAVFFLLVTDRNWPITLSASWLALAAVAAGLLPLLALAFRRFDVARDTPA